MSRRRALVALSAALVALALTLAACGGSADEGTTTGPAPRETPGETAAPSEPGGGLSPEFVECMADQGFEVASFADIHTVPQAALQACSGSLHGG